MSRNRSERTITNVNANEFGLKALKWADSHFKHFHFFNSNDHKYLHDAFPTMLMVSDDGFEFADDKNVFENIQNLVDTKSDWLPGFFTYDIKNQIENLKSENPVTIAFPNAFFYEPKHIITISKSSVVIETSDSPDEIFDEIIHTEINFDKIATGELQGLTNRDSYIKNVDLIKGSIVEGDFYEMNYCVEFSCSTQEFDPLFAYKNLNAKSPMPFSVLLKYGRKYAICASPERFLKKIGEEVVSQPIKGTIKRGETMESDEAQKVKLFESEKERAENLMIVDLVRNDLAKSAVPGSVTVERLFDIYSFRQLHQMVSTVKARMKDDVTPTQVIKNAFPMGSMTGAPKIRVMQEIEKLEDTKRGLYSGAIGYFTPQGDFDFNVVIRTMLFDADKSVVSFHVGSAITYDADAEAEYDECLLKARAMIDVLGNGVKKEA